MEALPFALHLTSKDAGKGTQPLPPSFHSLLQDWLCLLSCDLTHVIAASHSHRLQKNPWLKPAAFFLCHTFQVLKEAGVRVLAIPRCPESKTGSFHICSAFYAVEAFLRSGCLGSLCACWIKKSFFSAVHLASWQMSASGWDKPWPETTSCSLAWIYVITFPASEAQRDESLWFGGSQKFRSCQPCAEPSVHTPTNGAWRKSQLGPSLRSMAALRVFQSCAKFPLSFVFLIRKWSKAASRSQVSFPARGGPASSHSESVRPLQRGYHCLLLPVDTKNIGGIVRASQKRFNRARQVWQILQNCINFISKERKRRVRAWHCRSTLVQFSFQMTSYFDLILCLLDSNRIGVKHTWWLK